MHRDQNKRTQNLKQGLFFLCAYRGLAIPVLHDINVSQTLQCLTDVLRTVTLSSLFFLQYHLKTSQQSVGEPDFCLQLLRQRAEEKRQKNDTDCKYILPKETYEINRSGWTQLADCLLTLHHARPYGFSNHYLGCSWNTNHILQKHCMESSLRRITVLYQNRITKTLQSALFGFCVKIRLKLISAHFV